MRDGNRKTVAFQGERGAFSEQAVHQLLGPRINLLSCDSFEKTFLSVVQKKAHACVVPIENTLAGSIHKNLDLLLDHRLKIVGETRVRIEHHLITLPGVKPQALERVISHPVALEQCQRFLRHYPRLKIEPAYDTAGSVKLLVQHGWRDTAAIAGSLAARIYGCKKLKRNIEDHEANFTRFWLLERALGSSNKKGNVGWKDAGGNKTSIVFSMKSVPGALFKCLGVFALRDINLTKIESRPLVGKPFEYFFYVDFLGNPAEERCRNALRHLEESTDFLRVLGCYRRG